MSDQSPTGPKSTPPLSAGQSLAVAAGLLAIPPLLPILAAFWPEYVPVPFVENARLDDLRGVLVGLGVMLFVLNATVVALFYRYLQ